jgi:hypothetical protein
MHNTEQEEFGTAVQLVSYYQIVAFQPKLTDSSLAFRDTDLLPRVGALFYSIKM